MALLPVKTVMQHVDLKNYFNKLNSHQAKLKYLTINEKTTTCIVVHIMAIVVVCSLANLDLSF